VNRSIAADEWRAEGREQGRIEAAAAAVLAVLEARFQSIAPDLADAITRTTDIPKLRAWLPAAATAATLDEFRAQAGV
jgi:hypothetical protein